MKRSTIIILSFIGLTLVLSSVFIALKKIYIAQAHHIDIYEGFVIRYDCHKQAINVYFKTGQNSKFQEITTTQKNWRENETGYETKKVFIPTADNVIPVKLLTPDFEIKRNGIFIFSGKPDLNKPIYMQKTEKNIDIALLIKSPIRLRMVNDTLYVESVEHKSDTCFYSFLSEKTKVLSQCYTLKIREKYTVNGYIQSDSMSAPFLHGFNAFTYRYDMPFRLTDSVNISNNMKTLTLMKISGDTLQQFHSVRTKIGEGENLTVDWYINREHMKEFRRLKFNKK